MSLPFPARRWTNAGGFLICVALMAYALYAQHQLMLEPCPLCVLQRVAVIALGAVFLVAALHNPAGGWRWLYVVLVGLAASFGIAVAGYHVWMQNLPEDRVPACGPGLDYMLENFPLTEVVTMVLRGSGDCATVDWQFLGLSMPAWVLIAVSGLGMLGLWNNLRRA